MVLPLRIDLRTSPLPRECSTTELRQHDVRCSGATVARGNTRRGVAWQGKEPGRTREILAAVALSDPYEAAVALSDPYEPLAAISDPYETGSLVMLLGRFGSGGCAGSSRNCE